MQEAIEDLQVAVCGLIYYLYRQAGCPYGDTISGFDLWKETALARPFSQLVDPQPEDEGSDRA